MLYCEIPDCSLHKECVTDQDFYVLAGCKMHPLKTTKFKLNICHLTDSYPKKVLDHTVSENSQLVNWFNSRGGFYIWRVLFVLAHLWSPVFLGHLARFGYSVSHYFTIIRNPGATDSTLFLCRHKTTVWCSFLFQNVSFRQFIHVLVSADIWIIVIRV